MIKELVKVRPQMTGKIIRLNKIEAGKKDERGNTTQNHYAIRQDIAIESDDLDDEKVMEVGKLPSAQPKHQSRERKVCYAEVKNILDFDESGADMIEMSDVKPFDSRHIASDEEEGKDERPSSMSGS